jgi:glyoxylase-like metal-dependent hydrolase (beta-lactamase superfamily II)
MVAAEAAVRRERRRKERAALAFPLARPESATVPVEVADGIFWARLPMPMALDHVNVYLLRDTDGWWLVDTGLNLAETRGIWESLAAQLLDGLPFKALICTHFHYDHTGLASWLMERFDVPLYMSHGEFFAMRGLGGVGNETQRRQMQAYFRAGGFTDEQSEDLLAAFGRDRFMPQHPTSFRRLRDGHFLEIGGREWRIIAGEGHSPEHLCLYCEQEALLIAGDQLLPEISPNILVSDVEPEADPLGGWFSSLERLSELADETLVLPSHGHPFRGLPARIEQLQAHHHRHLEQLMAMGRTGDGFAVVEAMGVLFPRELPPTEQFLAFGETLAHLNWLSRRGLLCRELGEGGVYRYSNGEGELPALSPQG